MLSEASFRNWTLKLLSSIPRPVWWGGLTIFYGWFGRADRRAREDMCREACLQQIFGHEHTVKFKCIGFTPSSWTFFMLTFLDCTSILHPQTYPVSCVESGAEVQRAGTTIAGPIQPKYQVWSVLLPGFDVHCFSCKLRKDQATLRMVRGAERSSSWI